ncbi:hypothetical protein C4578_01910 [Candidatus Microgenomates bacterium]|jgi:hypothetical protein|nr:MAG: hypothetical protein C4578_01910 [Candidatus Microgenomates bacterium]
MRKLKFAIFALTLTLLLLKPKTVFGQTFSLSPQEATKSAGLSFPVDLNIDTGGQSVSAADVKITFDPEIIEIAEVEDGDFFGDITYNIYSGTLYVGGSFLEEGGKNGKGVMATLTLKGKSSGVGQLTFVCTTQNTDTNIFDTSAETKDIVNCAAIKNGKYTIQGSATVGGSESTPSATTATPTPEPPVSGISFPTFFSLGLGVLLMVTGLSFAKKHE